MKKSICLMKSYRKAKVMNWKKGMGYSMKKEKNSRRMKMKMKSLMKGSMRMKMMEIHLMKG